jgi:ribosomal protein S18 acetylase RimI-like enzyme
MGYTNASILVGSSNTIALGLYKRRGFVAERIVLSKKL